MDLEEAKNLLIEMRDNCLKDGKYNDPKRKDKAEAIDIVTRELEHLQKENEEFKNIDLTTVHIKGVCDEKERWRNKIREKIEMLKKIYELVNVESEADYCLRSKINILEDLLKEE